MIAAHIDIPRHAGWLLSLALLASLLSGCASRGVAPVSNRDYPAPRVSKAPQRLDYYRVGPGDTLYAIAWRYRLDYHNLAHWNHIRGPAYRIYPGQRLRLKPPPRHARPTHRPRHPATPLTRTTPESAVKAASPSPIRGAPKVQAETQAKARVKVTREAKGRLKLHWRWPTRGRVVQTFSASDPARKGIRIRGVRGQPVVAAEAGRVVYSGSGLVGYGNLIIIKHNDKYLTAYGYNQRLLVHEGEQVARGQRIAEMGLALNGREPVLHFEIRRGGRPINPLPLLPGNR